MISFKPPFQTHPVGLAALCLAAATVLMACKKEINWHELKYFEMDHSRDLVDAKIPMDLWKKIVAAAGPAEGAAKEGGGHEAKPAEHGAAKPAEHEASTEGHAEHGKDEEPAAIDSTFAPVKLFFYERNEGILNEGPTSVEFGPGGGQLDMKDVVSDRKGSFFFAAEFLKDKENLDRKIYFVSNSQKRKLGKDEFGAGCDHYFDLSKAFQKLDKSQGFLVNTTAGRHVSALAGIYVFTAMVDGKMNLAAVTLRDSRYPELECPRVAEKAAHKEEATDEPEHPAAEH